ncbi:unnamed protein product [Brachionus calyciflorus]|uniref:Uncharacterized protein n=1 Tax=Brachionus calyciflorus TaxID=104777 RepID=A0A813NNA0_9BILA|nr:unnamed protein product [Brachionus calyciflorus]
MVNPYALNARQTQKKVTLGQSQALKKFEKIQAKHTGKIEKKTNKFKKNVSINSSGDENSILNDDDDDDQEDDDSVFKNLKNNKFVKNKLASKSEKKIDKVDNDSEVSKTSDSDIEISVADRSSTPNRKSSLHRPSSRLLSAASSLTDFQSSNLPKRSPSRVKFVKQDSTITDEDESIESLLNNNLVLDIDDLEPVSKNNKFLKKNKIKSPLNSERRSASVASIIEESEVSTATVASVQSPSLMDANLILDIHDLDKSESSISKSSKKSSKSSKKKDKKDRKKKKRSKTPTSLIETETEYRTADSSIVTEIGHHDKKSIKSDSDLDISQSYNRSVIKDKSYFEDFETDPDLTIVSRADRLKRKHLSFAESNKKELNNIEVQVDPNDLLKHSDLIRSVNAYNPSSLLLASVTFLNEKSNLKDLNQLTGFNLINQTFNDLIRMNVNFMKNFLATQKSLYEQQIASIQPK